MDGHQSNVTAATSQTNEASSSAVTLQIVNEDQEFTNDLSKYMQTWNLYDKGFSYDVIAVFGSQSTGKSTLLNGVFGTQFGVMSETERRQTTKGIWMSKAVDANVLVMDVEGTDGRERGEDQDFERKSALFSMASAEVILVNLWEHQIGLYQGANMGLLKTVFEVNLSLFQAGKNKSHDRSLLLFVIRDHIGATPLRNLQNTLIADLNKLWDSLAKPDSAADSKISDYFDMAFTTLPHKLLQPDQFAQGIKDLRKRFVDPKDPDYAFKSSYHKRIPADGCAPYMAGIWDQVVHNKDLDLPTQQELLAQFRCDEIASVSYSEFDRQIAQFLQPVASGTLVKALGQGMKVAREAAISQFDKDASRYHAGVYQRKRTELMDKMHAALSPLFMGQLQNLHKNVLARFKSELLAGLKGDGYDFGSVVENTRQKAEADYRKEADEIMLDETSWSYEQGFEAFQAELTGIADTCRVEETRKMVTMIERNFKKQIAEPVELALNKPSPTMWDQILSAFKDALSKAEAQYMRKAKSFNCTEEENATALASLRKRAWLAAKDKINEQTVDATMLIKLKLNFEDRFRYDDEGVPRVWKPTDDIDALFRKAKEETLALIPLFAQIKPADSANAFDLPEEESSASELDEPEFDFASSLIIFSETKQDELASRFRREADAYYIEAKRSLVSSISQIPAWIYGVMFLLGWNEIIAVIRSPLYFTALAILAGVAYVVFQMNMAGPVLRVAQGTYDTASQVLHDKLREHFAQTEPIRVPADLSSSDRDQRRENIELRKMQ